MSMTVLPPGCRSVRFLDQQRDALPATNAGGGDTIAQAGALQFSRDGDGEAHAGRAERMADGDGAAVDVELVLIEPERARAGHDLRAEGFVDLEAVDGLERQARPLQHRSDRRDRAGAHD